MNRDILEKADYLRERANVTYEEAMQLLEQNNGDVAASLVELEKQGRVYAQKSDGRERDKMHYCHQDVQEAKEKAANFFKDACKTRIVIEKQNGNGEKETVANVSAPVAAVITVVAPYLSLAAGVFALATGHQFKIKKENGEG
jgi:translation elongation factor EF-Ts